jgi:plasmid stability protein
MKDAKSKDLSELFNTITVRNVPADVDEAITRQAKAAGKSKSDFVQEFLTATFGDLIGNFIRTSELVALMDLEMARMAGTVLSEHVYDLEMTQAGHREFCRISG